MLSFNYSLGVPVVKHVLLNASNMFTSNVFIISKSALKGSRSCIDLLKAEKLATQHPMLDYCNIFENLAGQLRYSSTFSS